MFKIKKINFLPDFIIKAEFVSGVQKLYDMKPLFDKYEAFKPLKDIPGLFAKGRIDCGGYGITWTDDTDIDSSEIWHNGKCVLNTEEEFIAQAMANVEADIKAGRVFGHFDTVDELIADLKKDTDAVNTDL